jgi:hypothetical protein
VSGAPKPIVTVLEVLGAWTVAVSLPVLSTFGEHPEHFALLGAERRDLVVFPILLALVIPLCVALVVIVCDRIEPTLGLWAHAVVLGALIGLFAAELLLDAGGSRAFLIGAATAVVATLAFVARPGLRAWPALMSAAMPLAIVLFLASPAGTLLRSGPRHLEASDSNGRSVVLVVFDELPVTTLLDDQGKIDETRFPNFARLAKRSVWHRDASAVSVVTQQASPAILTGRYPGEDTPSPTAAAHPENLFSLLAPTHELHVYEQFAMCEVGCGDSLNGSELDRQSQLLSDSVEVLRRRLRGDEIGTLELGPERGPKEVARLRAFTDSLAEFDGTPSLYFVHAAFPHKPFQFLPGGERYEAGSTDFARVPHPAGDWTYETEAAADFVHRRHLAQTMYADSLLGEVLDELDAQGLWEDAAVIVTADHGEAFIPGEPRRVASPGNLRAIGQIPLFVHTPDGEQGTVSDTPVQVIDVVPMLARALDLDLPYDVDGSADGSRPRVMQEAMTEHPDMIPVPPLPHPPVAVHDLATSPYAPRGLDHLLGSAIGTDAEASCEGRVEVDARVSDGTPPIYVVGGVHDLLANGPFDVALVADERIAGITRTFPEALGPDTFGALLEPQLVGDAAAEDITAYVLDGDRATPLCPA